MDREALLFSIDFALRHRIKPRVRWKDEHHSRFAARVVLEQLELSGYRITEPERKRAPTYFPQRPRADG